MKIILDSDALFALYFINDAHHLEAKKILQTFSPQDQFFVTNLVLQESATVISHKIGQSQALDFLKQLKKTTTQELFLTRQLTVKAWRLFYQQTRQDTSFVDCANLAIARELAFDRIFSFDRFYRQFIPRGSNLIS